MCCHRICVSDCVYSSNNLYRNGPTFKKSNMKFMTLEAIWSSFSLLLHESYEHDQCANLFGWDDRLLQATKTRVRLMYSSVQTTRLSNAMEKGAQLSINRSNISRSLYVGEIF